jgi:hypothetical protein
MMFMAAPVVPALVNALLGLLGIALARRQLSRSRLMYWLMAGSGVVLCMPLALLLIGLLSAFNLIGGPGRRGSSLLDVWRFLFWMRWPAYALLLLGFVRLRIAQRRAAADIEARRPSGESVRSGTATIEAVVGGAIVTLLIGLVGSLAGAVIAAASGSMSELGTAMGAGCGLLGLGLGLAGGLVAGHRASRSGIGAHPRFWFPVLAAFLGALASTFVLTFVLPSLLSWQPYASRYGYYNSTISQLALVFPFVCGFAGYLVSLRAKRGFTGWFVLGCLLLTLAVVTALPINVRMDRAIQRWRRAPDVPAFLRYPREYRMTGRTRPAPGGDLWYNCFTQDSSKTVVDFYRRALSGWDSLPAEEWEGLTVLTYASGDGARHVTIRVREAGASFATSIYLTYTADSGNAERPK